MTAIVFYAVVLLVFCLCGAITEWTIEKRRHRKLRQRIARYGRNTS